MSLPDTFFERTIYYANKPLVLTANAGIYRRENPSTAGYLTLTGAFPRQFRLAFEHLQKPRSRGAIIEDMSPEALLEEIHRMYTPIEAGGGVVFNERGDVLLIYRRNRWDLPKGKLDDGEDIAECALREVREETGLHNLEGGPHICDTYHIYAQKGEQLLKRTAWYRMSASSSEVLRPQIEEAIEEARWVAPEDLSPIVFKSYEAIREVLTAAGVKWQ